MYPENQPRNKMIVALRNVWEETKDPDLSIGKIASVMNIKKGTVQRNYDRDKEKYSIKGLFKKRKQ